MKHIEQSLKYTELLENAIDTLKTIVGAVKNKQVQDLEWARESYKFWGQRILDYTAELDKLK